ncbi:hypothetical protein A2686_00285 [Candidatus Woesebacteria bacterium RIFCSPHIGHO2_01_FULL_38_10]|nr:MAG: hypothetical protein A2686_00285 [Candidatus Woesebacteria bacterium RIFCSPHIGHO2_01_FULL_38_10]
MSETSENTHKDQPETPRKITRREFIIKSASALALLALKGSTASPIDTEPAGKEPPPPPEQNQDKERKKKPNTKTLVIDITPDTFVKLEKYGLSVMTEEKLAQLLGTNTPLTIDELRKYVPDDEDLQLSVAAHFLRLMYQDHADKVTESMEKTSKYLGREFEEAQTEHLSGDSLQSFSSERDDKGNPVFRFRLDPEKLKELIGQSDATFVNLSWQTIGKVTVEMFYSDVVVNEDAINPMRLNKEGDKYVLPDGRRITEGEWKRLFDEYQTRKIVRADSITLKPHDAYANEETAYQGLRDITVLANAFPEKIFFIAAGNPVHWNAIPNISEAITRLEEEGLWSENIIPVGFAHYDEERDKVYNKSGKGAYYYVDEKDFERLKIQPATSFATPIAKEVVSNYFAKRNLEPTPDKVREFLDSHSRGEEGYQVIDIAKIKEKIDTVRKRR